MQIRLNKFLSEADIASRRKADDLILSGKIKIDGKIVKELGLKIDPDKQTISYQNKPIQPQNHVYLMLNKPKGYTSTTRKFKGEKNILELVKHKERIFPVGRLDKDSTGLIFLTNDGDWANQISHPSNSIEKEYLVELNKPIKKELLDKMKLGIKDKSDLLKIKTYKINSPVSVNLVLTQGHKREIKRLFRHFGFNVKNLQRIRIGKWQLGGLQEGDFKKFNPEK